MPKESDEYANDEEERAAMIEELAGGVYPPPASPRASDLASHRTAPDESQLRLAPLAPAPAPAQQMRFRGPAASVEAEPSPAAVDLAVVDDAPAAHGNDGKAARKSRFLGRSPTRRRLAHAATWCSGASGHGELSRSQLPLR